MPATIRANIQRKLQISDRALKRAIEHLADVYITVNPQHPDVGASLKTYMVFLDHIRQFHKDFYQLYWGTTEAYLWEATDLQSALDSATIVSDPKHGSRKRC